MSSVNASRVISFLFAFYTLITVCFWKYKNLFQQVEIFKMFLKEEIMFWLKSFVVVTMKETAMRKRPRRLCTQTGVKRCPKRYLHCPRACTSQWIISDKVIRPPIHMLLGVFSSPTSPLPASCPFREVVNTVVGVAARRDSFLNTFQIPLIRVHFAMPCILSPDTPEHSVGIWHIQLNSSTHTPFHYQMGLHLSCIQYLWALESACSSPKSKETWKVATIQRADFLFQEEATLQFFWFIYF